jgi:hypothetical protein
VDDHQCGYITKLEKRKEGKKKPDHTTNLANPRTIPLVTVHPQTDG